MVTALFYLQVSVLFPHDYTYIVNSVHKPFEIDDISYAVYFANIVYLSIINICRIYCCILYRWWRTVVEDNRTLRDR